MLFEMTRLLSSLHNIPEVVTFGALGKIGHLNENQKYSCISASSISSSFCCVFCAKFIIGWMKGKVVLLPKHI